MKSRRIPLEFKLLLLIVACWSTFKLVVIGKFLYPYLGYDEGTYALFSRFILNGLKPYTDFFYAHPPLFIYLQALFFKVLGDSLFTARLFSVMMSALLSVATYFLVREITNERGALLAGIAITLDPTNTLFGTLSFIDVPVTTFTITALTFFVRYLKEEKSRDLALFSIFSAIAALTKVTALPYIGFSTLVLFIALGKGKEWLFEKVDNFSPKTLVGAVAGLSSILIIIFTVSGGLIKSETWKAIFVPFLIDAKYAQAYITLIVYLVWIAVFYSFVNKKPPFTWLKSFISGFNFKKALAALTPVLTILSAYLITALFFKGFVRDVFLSNKGRAIFFLIFWANTHTFTDWNPLVSYYLPVQVLFTLSMELVLIYLFFKALEHYGYVHIGSNPPTSKLLLIIGMLSWIISPAFDFRYVLPSVITIYVFLTVAFSKDKNVFYTVLGAMLIFAVLFAFGMTVLVEGSPMPAVMSDLSRDFTQDNSVWFSTNPEVTYIIGKRTLPYEADIFGHYYLVKVNWSEFLTDVFERSDYFVFDNWLTASWKHGLVKSGNDFTKNFTLQNGQLVWSEAKRGILWFFVNVFSTEKRWGFSPAFINGHFYIYERDSLDKFEIVIFENESLYDTVLIRLEGDKYVVFKNSEKLLEFWEEDGEIVLVPHDKVVVKGNVGSLDDVPIVFCEKGAFFFEGAEYEDGVVIISSQTRVVYKHYD